MERSSRLSLLHACSKTVLLRYLTSSPFLSSPSFYSLPIISFPPLHFLPFPFIPFPSFPFLPFIFFCNYKKAYSTWVLTLFLSTFLTSIPPWYRIKNTPSHSVIVSPLKTLHSLLFLFFFIILSGAVDASMKTSIKLCEYDDILEPRDIYSLLCLTSIRNKFYGICSKAFVKVRFSLV